MGALRGQACTNRARSESEISTLYSYKALRFAGGLRRLLRSLRKGKSTSNYAKRTEVHD